MGFFSTILGLCGFGIGISMGLVIGYFLFVYLQPNDVKVSFPFDSILLLLLLLNTHLLNCIVGSSNPIDSRPRPQIHAPYASRDPPLGQEPRLRPCTSFNHFDSFFDSLID